MCYIEDASGGLRILLKKGLAANEIGKRVEVSGKLESGSKGTFLIASSMTTKGNKALPPAPAIDAAPSTLERYAERRVQLEATIDKVSWAPLSMEELTLQAGGERLTGRLVSGTETDPESFLGARVELTGVAVPRAKADGHAFEVWVSRQQDVVVLGRAAQPQRMQAERRETRTVRSALAVHRIAPGVAALHLPVDFEAVVTYWNADANDLFVQDATDGIYVQAAHATNLRLIPGDWVRVRGVTVPGEFAPSIGKATLEKLGRRALPTPDPDIEAAFTGLKDSRWVQFRGVIQDVKVSDHQVTASLVWGKHRFQAAIQMAPGRAKSMVDREVTLFGACGAIFNDRRQLLGINLFVPGPDFAVVTGGATPDPFHLPVRLTETLLQFGQGDDIGHRVHVKGVVTLGSPEGPTWIRDGSGGLRISSHNRQVLREGDVVDVTGFAEAGNFSPLLESAEIRKLYSSPEPRPVTMTAAEAARGENESQLIQVEGTLVDTFFYDGTRTFRLESYGDVFTASIPESVPVPPIRPRSQLRLTGICAVSTDDRGGFSIARGFRLTLRSAADIIVVRNGTWFTPERLALGIVGSVVVAFLALCWVVSLRRNVRRKTFSLNQALERAREAEALEQSRRSLFELVANNDRIDRVMEELVAAAERHATNARCGVRIEIADGPVITVPASGWDVRQSIASTPNRLLVPIELGEYTAGFILLESLDGSPLNDRDRDLASVWGRYASIAVERWASYEQLSFRAQYDALTGLHNRASLNERLRQEVASAARTGDALGILYVDLDDFKMINDTWGHDTGDAVLREAAERISRSVRRSDVVARQGGDEFVVLLNQIADGEEALRIGALVRSVLNARFSLNGHDLKCCGSIGIAVLPADGRDAETLMKAADRRMYENKAARKESRAVEDVLILG